MHPALFSVLDDTFSWAELVCASVLLRLGTGGVTTALRHVLEDTMGTSEVIKIHTLLYTFTGLLIVLGMMMICKFFTLHKTNFICEHNVTSQVSWYQSLYKVRQKEWMGFTGQ
jgi:hypothetical protein